MKGPASLNDAHASAAARFHPQTVDMSVGGPDNYRSGTLVAGVVVWLYVSSSLNRLICISLNEYVCYIGGSVLSFHLWICVCVCSFLLARMIITEYWIKYWSGFLGMIIWLKTHTQTHTHTHKNKQTHTHTHPYPHTHTHTQTHTGMYSMFWIKWKMQYAARIRLVLPWAEELVFAFSSLQFARTRTVVL